MYEFFDYSVSADHYNKLKQFCEEKESLGKYSRILQELILVCEEITTISSIHEIAYTFKSEADMLRDIVDHLDEYDMDDEQNHWSIPNMVESHLNHFYDLCDAYGISVGSSEKVAFSFNP